MVASEARTETPVKGESIFLPLILPGRTNHRPRYLLRRELLLLLLFLSLSLLLLLLDLLLLDLLLELLLEDLFCIASCC
jgi:hypothetical protein